MLNFTSLYKTGVAVVTVDAYELVGKRFCKVRADNQTTENFLLTSPVSGGSISCRLTAIQCSRIVNDETATHIRDMVQGCCYRVQIDGNSLAPSVQEDGWDRYHKVSKLREPASMSPCEDYFKYLRRSRLYPSFRFGQLLHGLFGQSEKYSFNLYDVEDEELLSAAKALMAFPKEHGRLAAFKDLDQEIGE